jgi:hypothetical protein
VTYRTHPSLPLTAAFFLANTTNNQQCKLFTEFVRIHLQLLDAGFGGYAVLAPNDIQMFYTAVNVTQAEANNTFDPFFAFAQNLTSEGVIISSTGTTSHSYYEWYQLLFGGGQGSGFNIEMASHLINRDIIEEPPSDIADAVTALGRTEWM